MRKIWIIGIGAGHPEQLTIQAIKAMNATDVFFVPYKGSDKQALNTVRKELCERYIEHRDYRLIDFRMPPRDSSGGDYPASVQRWRLQVEDCYQRLIRDHLNASQSAAFLVWGDPALYDGTIDVCKAIQGGDPGIEIDVIPGISSLQALAARHQTTLTRSGQSLTIAPGRKWSSTLCGHIDNLAVMLDATAQLKALSDPDLYIYWGANIGLPEEVLVEGALNDVMPEIEASRRRLRQAQGWVMDSCLIRRHKPE